MGSVYDRTEKEYYHNKRHRCTCRDTGILLPNCGQGQLLPDAVFLSAQLYLYRPLCRMGTFRAPAYCAKAGRALSDCRVGADNSLVHIPLGEVFYLLAARCNAVSVVSILSADAVCAHARAAYRHIPR